jgi:hypothetical protein
VIAGLPFDPVELAKYGIGGVVAGIAMTIAWLKDRALQECWTGRNTDLKAVIELAESVKAHLAASTVASDARTRAQELSAQQLLLQAERMGSIATELANSRAELANLRSTIAAGRG